MVRTRSWRTGGLLLGLMTSAVVHRIGAQTTTDTIGIVVAAYAVERDAREARTAALDPHVLERSESGELKAGSLRPVRLLSALRAQGVAVLDPAVTTRCIDGPHSECFAHGMKSFIAIGTPEIRGDTATVLIAVRARESSPGGAREVLDEELTLVRAGSGWKVAARRYMREAPLVSLERWRIGAPAPLRSD